MVMSCALFIDQGIPPIIHAPEIAAVQNIFNVVNYAVSGRDSNLSPHRRRANALRVVEPRSQVYDDITTALKFDMGIA